MFEFRITKYDPRHRNASGAYTREEWTSYSDVGRARAGRVLSLDEYRQTEAAYVETAVQFMCEAGVGELVVRGFENARKALTSISEGAVLPRDRVAQVLRALLREEFWCRLEGPSAYVHIGWDFYMYVGVPMECSSAQAEAGRRGLFVEPFVSPYSDSSA